MGARPAARPAAKPAARPTATATRPAARSNAPATSASSRSAPAAAKPTQQTPAAQQAPQQQAPVSGGGGPGFLGTMFATAAGSAAGHVVGRSVMNAWEGSGSSERPEMEPLFLKDLNPTTSTLDLMMLCTTTDPLTTTTLKSALWKRTLSSTVSTTPVTANGPWIC